MAGNGKLSELFAEWCAIFEMKAFGLAIIQYCNAYHLVVVYSLIIFSKSVLVNFLLCTCLNTIGHRGPEGCLRQDHLRQARAHQRVRRSDQPKGQPLHQGDSKDVGGHRFADQRDEGPV